MAKLDKIPVPFLPPIFRDHERTQSIYYLFSGVTEKRKTPEEEKKIPPRSRAAMLDLGSPVASWRLQRFPQVGVGAVRDTTPLAMGRMDRQMRLRWRERTRGVRPIRDTPDRGVRDHGGRATATPLGTGGPCVRRRHHHDCTTVD